MTPIASKQESEISLSWARMKIKPSKSRSLSLRRGVRNNNNIFVVGGENILLASEQPSKSLGRQYSEGLTDSLTDRWGEPS